jgi:hypothetical protein
LIFAKRSIYLQQTGLGAYVMPKQFVKCPVCNGTGQDSFELKQMRGLHLQEMPTEVFTEPNWGVCKYCEGSGELASEEAERYLKIKRSEKKAQQLGAIIGGLVGLLAGIVFGAFYDESWVPIIFGVLGLLIGALIGLTLGLFFHSMLTK